MKRSIKIFGRRVNSDNLLIAIMAIAITGLAVHFNYSVVAAFAGFAAGSYSVRTRED